jgi:DNA-binding NarL/FixJ family response regulator
VIVILQQADYQQIVALGSEVLGCGNMTDLQDAAMQHLPRLMPAKSMMFLQGEPLHWRPQEMCTQGFDPEFPYVYLALTDTDPGVPMIVRNWQLRKSEVLNSSLIMPAGVECEALVYQQVLKPRQLRHTLAFSMAVGDDSYGILVLFRSEHAGLYSHREMAIAKVFMPFLKAALDRVQVTEQKRRLTRLFDHVSQDLDCRALLVFDSQMRPFCALPPQEKLVGDILRDVTGPTGQKSILSPNLQSICKNFLGAAGKLQMNLTICYRDPAGQYMQAPAELRKHAINGDIGMEIRIGHADSKIDIQARLDTCGLTAQERVIVQHLSRGLKNAEIAKNLAISSSTVANHVSAVLTKAKLPNRSQLMSTPNFEKELSALALTNREKQVILARFSGLSTKSIASQFNISPVTVQNHLRAIYRKLGVSGLRGVASHLQNKTTRPPNSVQIS